MNADDVNILLTAHEAHCERRQKAVHGRIDRLDTDIKSLSRLVYVGLGVLLAAQFVMTIYAPAIQDAAK